MRSWLLYTLVRLGLLAVVFTILMLVGLEWWWSALFATIIALVLSYIFFGKLRDTVAADLAERREKRLASAGATDLDPDAADEDAAS